MDLTNGSFRMIAKTLLGLEEVLAGELRDLGAQEVEPLNRAVSFQGDLELMYSANLNLRTALKVLVPIRDFNLRGERDLYREVRKVDWSAWLNTEQTFAVEAVGKGPELTHTHFTALRVKDGIVDYFRDKMGLRPSVNTQFPDLRVHLHLTGTSASLSVDSSGELLSKRGYRKLQHRAPINESLAAGMILLSGWDRETPFMDPMCGSGTIALEAASILTQTAPNLGRPRFAFQSWNGYDAAAFERLKAAARERILPITQPSLASDKDPAGIQKSRKHLMHSAMPPEAIRFKVSPFEQLKAPEEPRFLMMNPPYGERLEVDMLAALYQGIGDTLKQRYNGSEAWIISSDIAALKRVGLRPTRKIRLLNGSLECSFRQFKMYAGSRKPQSNPQSE